MASNYMNRMVTGAVCKDTEMKHFMARLLLVVLLQMVPKLLGEKSVCASLMSILEAILPLFSTAYKTDL